MVRAVKTPSVPRGSKRSKPRTGKVAPTNHGRTDAPRLARVVSWRPGEAVMVDVGVGPVPAVLASPLDEAAIRLAIETEQPAIVGFLEGDAQKPVLLGLVERAPRKVELELPKLPTHAVVDGQRVSIIGEDEIELRCGKASIVLRRNGKVVIRGVYLESASEGVNRIKGGSVNIN